MRSSRILLLAFAMSICCLPVFAQTINLPGKVLEENGDPIPGATVRFKSQRGAVITKDDGTFSIPSAGRGILVISATGFMEKEIDVAGLSQVTVSLTKTNKQLDEVVVTAYGIRRAKNTLPYAAQQISGDEANKTRVSNIAAGLSGKVSGLQIIQNNAIGGSVNVVIRGTKSLSGNNQALFVVDGTPIDNNIITSSSANTNVNTTSTGQGGYDYGNAATDINPDDIASINVLKGAAATALYGSRAANGVIMITTKKGRAGTNITVNTGIIAGRIDKSTFVKYQHEYGAGRSDVFATNPVNTGFRWVDVTGDGQPESVVNMVAPRSWGPKYDPTLLVYQWDAFDPLSPTYHKATPWVAGANPDYFYSGTALTNNESIYLDGASDKGSFKLGYSRNNDKGIVPNSNVSRNTINFGATYKLNDKLNVSSVVNYTQDKGLGRYATGYDGNRNPNVVLRQYGETNVNFKEQKEAYFRARKNITWNWSDPALPNGTGLFAGFYNNIYWNGYENYEADNRNRVFGNIALNYQLLPWLSLMGRISLDTYNQFQEERSAVTSAGTPFYSRTNMFFRELNYDLIATASRDLNESFKLNALLGVNMRRNAFTSLYQTTSGGLIVPYLYDIANSKGTIPAPVERDEPKAVDGYFAGATLTYKEFLSLDATFRRDRSSTLPSLPQFTKNAYNYYAISGSWVFYEHLKDRYGWLSSGKLRANYATVGNDAPWGSIMDVYDQPNTFVAGSTSSILFSLPDTKNNDRLVPERTNSKEIGLEMSFLKGRIGFDATFYLTHTINQILPSQVSSATGYSKKYVNAGNVQNQGIEVSIFGTPVKSRDLSWDITVNFTRNRNKVLALNNGSKNLVLGSFQGGITLNAPLGQPFGILESQGYQMLNGQRLVSDTGLYKLTTTSTNVIGNINPDWIGGITNTLRYKNFNLSFLVDVRKGGSVWSLDQYYGQMSGILPNSAGLNELGHPKRDPVSAGGGILLPGVKADGKPNTTRITITSPISTVLAPPDFSYDAGYVKLRELSFGYHIPGKALGNGQKFLKGIDLQLIGRNLWIIHKNLPMADPEETIAAGNLQGYQSGAYPTVRSLGLNIKLQF